MTGDEDDLLNTGRIVPVYRLTEGVTQRMLRRLVRTALDVIARAAAGNASGRDSRAPWFSAVGERRDAGRAFSRRSRCARVARNRFAFEELLGIQIGVLASRARRHHEHKKNIHTIDGPHLAALRRGIPSR